MINVDDLLSQINQEKKILTNQETGGTIEDKFEENRSLEQPVKIVSIKTPMHQKEVYQYLVEVKQNEFDSLFKNNLEASLFPTLASSGDEIFVLGWGLNEKLAEEVLMVRHRKKNPSLASTKPQSHYEVDKVVKTLVEEENEVESETEKFEIRKRRIIEVIDEAADNARVAIVLKNYAEMVDYDAALCRPILDRNAHFYTRMEEMDLNEAVTSRKIIQLLTRIGDVTTMNNVALSTVSSSLLKIAEQLVEQTKLLNSVLNGSDRR